MQAQAAFEKADVQTLGKERPTIGTILSLSHLYHVCAQAMFSAPSIKKKALRKVNWLEKLRMDRVGARRELESLRLMTDDAGTKPTTILKWSKWT